MTFFLQTQRKIMERVFIAKHGVVVPYNVITYMAKYIYIYYYPNAHEDKRKCNLCTV